MLVIGIDPGTETGRAAWDTDARKLLVVDSSRILAAMRWVEAMKPGLVVFEDARRRGRFDKMDEEQRKYGAAVREGAGSVKRDCAIWEEWLEEKQIPYNARAPRLTKKDRQLFAQLTGWTARTNEHGRDAALVVHGLNGPIAGGMVQVWQQRPNMHATRRSSPKVGRSAGTVARFSTIAGGA